MKPEEQAAHYDRIAYHWDSDQLDRDNGIRQHERALRLLKSPKTAIDIGCGRSGRIIDLFLENGFSVEGLGQPLYHAALGIPEILQIIDECACVCRHLENDDFPELHLYLIIHKKRELDDE